MKRFTIFFIMLLAIVISTAPAPAQSHDFGDFGMLFKLGTSPLEIKGVNAGIGLEVYFGSALSLRESIGGQVKSGGIDKPKYITTSADLLLHPAHTSNSEFYVGPSLFYDYTQPVSTEPGTSTVKFGAKTGALITPIEHWGFFFEYNLLVVDGGNGETTFSWGQPDVDVGMRIMF